MIIIMTTMGVNINYIIITNINSNYHPMLNHPVIPPTAAPSGFLASWMVPAEQHEHGGVDGDVIQTLKKMTEGLQTTLFIGI